MFAALLALAAPALATIYTTNPVAHTQAYGGQVLRIDWVDDGEAPNLPDIGPCSIDLCIGSESNQRCIQNLGESVDVSAASSISATIDPSVGENGKYYFIRYSSLNLKEGEYPYQQYSARFYLNSMEGSFDDEVKQLATSSTEDFIWATGTGANAASGSAAPSGSAGATDPAATGAPVSGSAGPSGAGAATGAAVPSGAATPSGSGKAIADTSSTFTSSRTSTTASRASASASPSPSADSGVAKFAAPGLFTLAACLAAYIAV